MSSRPPLDSALAEQFGPPALDTRRLQLFVISAMKENFAAAAGLLNLCPSAASHAIRGLEEDLGCTLFRRIGPRVALTRAGVRLLPLAQEALRQMERLRREVSLMEVRSQHLRIVAPEPLLTSLLPGALADFFESFPTMTLEVLPEQSVALTVEAARTEAVDLFLSAGPIPPEFVNRPLHIETLGLYAAPFFPLCRSSEIKVADLNRHRLFTADAATSAAVAQRLLGGIPPSTGQIWSLPSTQSALEMAKMGLGVAVLSPRDAAAYVSSGHLRVLPYHGPRLDRTIAACWPAASPPSWAAEVFLGLLGSLCEEISRTSSS